MKTSKKITISIIVSALVLIVVFKLYDVKKQNKADMDLVNNLNSEIPVITTLVRFETVQMDFSYNGVFEPCGQVTVISESQGKVKKYSINEGDFISEGDTLACLDNDLIGYQLETAESAYLKAEDDMQRFENLSPGQSVSRQQLQEIKLAHTNAKSNYLTIRKHYENAFIKAPISGTVSRRYFEKGSFIAAGNPVADLIDTRCMKFNAWFTSKDLIEVKTGQTVMITTGLYPGSSYEGVIKVIGVRPDNSKRYLVQSVVKNNPERPLISGIDGTIHIENNSGEKSLVIPRNCIISSAIEPMVYVVSDNVAKLRTIVISKIINNLVIVQSGLTEGETVVVSGQINLQNNTRVNILKSQNL